MKQMGFQKRTEYNDSDAVEIEIISDSDQSMRSKRTSTITECCPSDERRGVWPKASAVGASGLFLQHISDMMVLCYCDFFWVNMRPEVYYIQFKHVAVTEMWCH